MGGMTHDQEPVEEALFCRIAVVGLGLAGACVVRALALAEQHFERPLKVAAFEKASEPAMGASGNPLAICHPLHSADNNLASQLVDSGLQTTTDWLTQLDAKAQGWADLFGVIERDRDDALSLGGWVKPAQFVMACLASAHSILQERLTLQYNAPHQSVTDLKRSFDAVIVCTADDALLADAGLALRAIAGQVSWVEAELREGPDRVLCASGYVAPVVEGKLLVGASFDREELAPQVTEQGHEENFERLRELSPDLAEAMRARWPLAAGRASVRFATPDRLPHVGSITSLGALRSHPHPQRISQLDHLPRVKGVYVLLGLGSRGLSFAPLGAELIAQMILGAPPSLPERLIQAIDPARFVLRAHRRAAHSSGRHTAN